MAFRERLIHDASVRRTTEVDDGYGGLVKSETEVIPKGVVRFHVFNISPFDREALVHKYGLEIDAVLFKITLDYNPNVQVLDILEATPDYRFKILGLEEQWGRIRGAVPHHFSGTAQVESPRIVE